MSNYARYRDWHMWIGLILLIPLSVIAITGFLWNHEKSLGLKYERESDSPSTQSPPDQSGTLVAETGTWTEHSNTIDAALAAAYREWGSNVPLERIELKNEPGIGIVVKVKAVETADVKPYEIVWSATSGTVIQKMGDPKSGPNWAKVVHDLHTGKFFSKEYGFLWSDSSAIAILALGVTGVVLYLIPVLKKRGKQRKNNQNPAGASVPASRPAIARPAPVLAAARDDELA